jgi:hypothetical protein
LPDVDLDVVTGDGADVVLDSLGLLSHPLAFARRDQPRQLP